MKNTVVYNSYAGVAMVHIWKACQIKVTIYRVGTSVTLGANSASTQQIDTKTE